MLMIAWLTLACFPSQKAIFVNLYNRKELPSISLYIASVPRTRHKGSYTALIGATLDVHSNVADDNKTTRRHLSV